jgi:hypothetical protein
MIKTQQRRLALFEHIRRPFVLRLIALLVSGLIALLLGGALLLAGHGAAVTNLAQWSLTTVMSIAGNNPSLW